MSLRERLAANVRRARAARGWSQDRGAEAASIGVRTLQAIEAGDYNATIDIVERLAAAFGVDPMALLTPTGDRLPPRRRGRPPTR